MLDFHKSSPVQGSRQVRVLYVVTAFPRTLGDVITPWLVETIQRLGTAGIEVEVLAPAYRGLQSQVVRGIRVHRFRYAPADWETLSHDQTVPDRIRQRPLYLGLIPPYLACGMVAAARLARSGRFDLVHAFWPIPHAVLGLAAKYAGGLPLISTFFGVELTWLRKQLPVLRPVLHQIVRHSDAVTAISSYTAGLLRELVPSARPILVPFGATVDVGHHPLPRPAGGNPYTLLFVGRLVERKGVHVLLDAMRLLVSNREVRLEIVGDGPMRDELAERAAVLGLGTSVRFAGLVSDADLAHHYSSCDVFVLPAVVDSKGDTEGLGVVLIEALAYGKPVIASGVGGIPDIVQHGRTGLLVPPGDSAALAEAVATYMDDPATAERLADAGRRHVQRTFSWHGITQALSRLYQQVLDDARS
jgi:glycosyltransferase involved in cell wall biosynthesis